MLLLTYPHILHLLVPSLPITIEMHAAALSRLSSTLFSLIPIKLCLILNKAPPRLRDFPGQFVADMRYTFLFCLVALVVFGGLVIFLISFEYFLSD
jgi:hypothetical protein